MLAAQPLWSAQPVVLQLVHQSASVHPSEDLAGWPAYTSELATLMCMDVSVPPSHVQPCKFRSDIANSKLSSVSVMFVGDSEKVDRIEICHTVGRALASRQEFACTDGTPGGRQPANEQWTRTLSAPAS